MVFFSIGFDLGMCTSFSSAIVWQRWTQTGQIHIDRATRSLEVCCNIDG